MRANLMSWSIRADGHKGGLLAINSVLCSSGIDPDFQCMPDPKAEARAEAHGHPDVWRSGADGPHQIHRRQQSDPFGEGRLVAHYRFGATELSFVGAIG